jgi:hypothetical protein
MHFGAAGARRQDGSGGSIVGQREQKADFLERRVFARSRLDTVPSTFHWRRRRKKSATQ